MSVLEKLSNLSAAFRNYHAQTDEWLIERIGYDERAYEEIHKRYEKKIMDFVLSRFRNSGMAEDVVQHCFLQLFRYPDNFKGKRLKPYFFSIAVNHVLDEYKQSIVNIVSLDEKIEEGFDVAIDEEISNNVMFGEFEQLLAKFIKELNYDYQIVCNWIYFEKLKPSEVAEILKVPVRTITNINNICKLHFYKRFKEKYGNDEKINGK